MLSTKDGSDESAIRKLFMRVDANSDGTVDWDEFVTYMLMENQGNPHLNANNQVEALKFMPSKIVGRAHNTHAHKDMITAMCKLPPGSGNCYVTASKDGSFALWNSKVAKVQ